VERRFQSEDPDRLWVTDITEHPTREGKVYASATVVNQGLDMGLSIRLRERLGGSA